MSTPSDALHIAKDDLKEENFTRLRECAGPYGTAEIVQFHGAGGEVMDCIRVKVAEPDGPLDTARIHTLADHLDTGKTLFVMHPTYTAKDGVYATISARRGSLSAL